MTAATESPDLPTPGFKPRPNPRLRATVNAREATPDLGPEPSYKDRLISQRCAPCRVCGVDFVIAAEGVKGDMARVFGERGNWNRYHVDCWPWK